MAAHELDALDLETVYIAREPVALVEAVREADGVISNGNLTTVATCLLGGKPQLALPNSAEKYMTARRLELLGAGLAAPLANPGDVPAKIRAIVGDRSFRRAAVRFADRYRDQPAPDKLDSMVADLDRSCAAARANR